MTSVLRTANEQVNDFEALLSAKGLVVWQSEVFALYFACRARHDGVDVVTPDTIRQWCNDGRAIFNQMIDAHVLPFEAALRAEGLEVNEPTFPIDIDASPARTRASNSY